MTDTLDRLIMDQLKIPAERMSSNVRMEDWELWDSLRHMDVIIAIEQKYSVQLTFDEIVTMRSTDDIRRVLSQKGVKI